MRPLTPAQSIALANPCRFAFETAQPQFHHRLKYGLSLNLTVNSGHE